MRMRTKQQMSRLNDLSNRWNDIYYVVKTIKERKFKQESRNNKLKQESHKRN